MNLRPHPIPTPTAMASTGIVLLPHNPGVPQRLHTTRSSKALSSAANPSLPIRLVVKHLQHSCPRRFDSRSRHHDGHGTVWARIRLQTKDPEPSSDEIARATAGRRPLLAP